MIELTGLTALLYQHVTVFNHCSRFVGKDKIFYSRLEGLFLLRLRPQTQTWGRGQSEARATAQHTFDVVDHINMLIGRGNNQIPIAVMNLYITPLSESNIVNGKHCNMFIV